ncbi:RRXRR domain-containing protein [Streptomyces sp. NPDC003038]|uniref:RRXRR domain-containing protein n=1 Tax=unclassified Streptomyces TaxID=2593676 RepID=UPI0033B9B678
MAETGSGDAPRRTASRVFVLAKGGEPLMPCHPARARELLDRGRAVVARRAPFTIRLKHRTRAGSVVAGVQLRLDPGSKATGVAVIAAKPTMGTPPATWCEPSFPGGNGSASGWDASRSGRAVSIASPR